MNRLLCQIYLILVLLTVTTLSSLPYSPLALILLLLVVFITLRPLRLRLNIAITVGTIFLLPLELEPLLNHLTYTTILSPTAIQIIAVVATLPVIYLLDYNLRQNAPNSIPAHNIKGRYITTIPRALFASTLATLLASLILNNPTLLFTSITLALYLLAILIWVLYVVPGLPLEIPAMWKRVIAGTTADISLETISINIELPSGR